MSGPVSGPGVPHIDPSGGYATGERKWFPVLFVAALLVIAVLAIAAWFLFPAWFGRPVKAGEDRVEHRVDELEDSSTSLHYDVPEGQDPAVLTAALSGAGYLAQSHLVAGHNQLLIDRVDGRAPVVEDVRTVIESANTTTFEGGVVPSRVVFEEER